MTEKAKFNICGYKHGDLILMLNHAFERFVFSLLSILEMIVVKYLTLNSMSFNNMLDLRIFSTKTIS